MSAYVVAPTHIDALISTAIHGPADRNIYTGTWSAIWSDLTGAPARVEAANADECGAALLAECIESVDYRYPGDRSCLPGPVPTPDPEQYEWTDLGRLLTTVQALQAIDGYEYQSCEHPGWESSEAYRFCSRLRATLCHGLPGYREAGSWEVTVERALVALGVPF